MCISPLQPLSGFEFETPACPVIFIGKALPGPLFWIVNTIQIHHKYAIDNPNPIFKMD
jgi:hypothetical protein